MTIRNMNYIYKKTFQTKTNFTKQNNLFVRIISFQWIPTTIVAKTMNKKVFSLILILFLFFLLVFDDFVTKESGNFITDFILEWWIKHQLDSFPMHLLLMNRLKKENIRMSNNKNNNNKTTKSKENKWKEWIYYLGQWNVFLFVLDNVISVIFKMNIFELAHQ